MFVLDTAKNHGNTLFLRLMFVSATSLVVFCIYSFSFNVFFQICYYISFLPAMQVSLRLTNKAYYFFLFLFIYFIFKLFTVVYSRYYKV